jgi:hypothetical protein
MIKLYWAEEGVKMIEAPAKPQYHEIPKEDLVMYRIGAMSCIFSDIKEAEKVQELMRGLNSIKDYSYPGGDMVECDFKRSITIETIEIYSRELYDKIKHLKKGNKECEDLYKKLLSEYETEKERQDELSSRIRNRVSDVCTKYAEMDRMWNLYKDEYLPLAGDKSIAMAFLKKAYTVNCTTEQYIEGKMEKQERDERYPSN